MENSEAGSVGRDPRRPLAVPALHHGRDVHAHPPQPRLARAARKDPRHLRPSPDPRAVQRQHRGVGRPGHPHEQQLHRVPSRRRRPRMPARSSPVSAAAIYHMPIIVRNTENNPLNTTRFVRISHTPLHGRAAGEMQHPHRPGRGPGRPPPRPARSLCQPEDQPDPDRVAALEAGDWEYVFFLDYHVVGRRLPKRSPNSRRSPASRNSAVTGRSGCRHDRHDPPNRRSVDLDGHRSALQELHPPGAHCRCACRREDHDHPTRWMPKIRG